MPHNGHGARVTSSLLTRDPPRIVDPLTHYNQLCIEACRHTAGGSKRVQFSVAPPPPSASLQPPQEPELAPIKIRVIRVP